MAGSGYGQTDTTIVNTLCEKKWMISALSFTTGVAKVMLC